MERVDLEYNSQLERLIIPEYGRNVQALVNHCKTIEDKELRQATAREIVELMGRIDAPVKITKEYYLKLWKHFLIIADYSIDIDLPNGVSKDKEDDSFRADKPEYPEYLSEFRHYGHFVQGLVEKAESMEDSPEKDEFFKIIGSYMKLAYRTWNSKHYVSDEIIKEDLHHMTKEKYTLSEDVSLDYHSHLSTPHISHIQNTKKKRTHKNVKIKSNKRRRR